METLALAAVLPQLPAGTRPFGGFDRPAITFARESGRLCSPTAMMMIPKDGSPQLPRSAIKEHSPPCLGFMPRASRVFWFAQGTAAEIAEEIAQEAMLLVWRKASLFDASRASASTWI